jgi:hypothetical protein
MEVRGRRRASRFAKGSHRQRKLEGKRRQGLECGWRRCRAEAMAFKGQLRRIDFPEKP